jgi:uncharacterized membrane-anchored protein
MSAAIELAALSAIICTAALGACVGLLIAESITPERRRLLLHALAATCVIALIITTNCLDAVHRFQGTN